MNRRRFLGAAGGLGLAAMLRPGPAQAAASCVTIHSGKARCAAGLTQTPPIAEQPCRGLAWATCLAYLLTGYGARIDAEAVLARYALTAGREAVPRNETARLLAAAGTWSDGFGRRFLVRTERLPDLAAGHLAHSEAVRILPRLARQPVLCGAAGHTTLLTQLRYDEGMLTRTKITEATVRDPYSGSHGLRRLSAAELARPFPVVALSIRAL